MKNEKLIEAIKRLCHDLKIEGDKAFPSLAKYRSYHFLPGRKYCKIVSYDTFNGDDRASETVWGFINMTEFSKNRKMASGTKNVLFKEGDVLMSAGWSAPALNASRGNLLKGYNVDRHNQHGPSYL